MRFWSEFLGVFTVMVSGMALAFVFWIGPTLLFLYFALKHGLPLTATVPFAILLLIVLMALSLAAVRVWG